MASRTPPPGLAAPSIPHKFRRSSRSSLSPSPNLYRQALDASTPADEGSPTARRNPKHTTTEMMTPTRQASPPTTSVLQQPTTPPKNRPTLTREVASAPEFTRKANIEGFNDSPITMSEWYKPTPCGRRSYSRKFYMDKHVLECPYCKTALQEQAREQHSTQRMSVPSETFGTEKDTNDKQGAVDMLEEEGDSGLTEIGASDRIRNLECGPKQLATPANGQRSPDESTSTSSQDESVPVKIAVTTKLSASPKPKKSKTPLDLEDEPSPDEQTKNQTSNLPKDATGVQRRLREAFESTLTPKDREGYVYIFRDPTRPDLRKIGRSFSPESRLKQVEYKCGLKLVLVHDRRVGYYTRTERLIHAELTDLCHPYTCKTCGAKHGEWFQLDDHTSRASVDKWVNFMRVESPYDLVSKELHLFWRHWVAKREPLFTEGFDVKNLRKTWAHILSPSSLDRLNYQIENLSAHSVWGTLWKFSWQVNAVLAWTTAFVVFQHPSTFVAMFVSISCTFMRMSQDLQQVRQSSPSPQNTSTTQQKGPRPRTPQQKHP
ncbi:uncharacterized protein K460DRAFT_367115 [Cucurbitaria berberidis CBS 394.84]|uniref:Bacteriophage T5 Orf172 DNA-binding domain-containing protein n=1 Tax=Cucurbitaria berberidis CBS 394.84 TaxID=1168544 RepID=A0A9P4L9F0_9PLEO|nr:uncharacterized protein K460DRAFT_367115 [Cucurbitaria berberidis CBS 394.84]KAF1846307.1 hypothetical protein K460DRAFT_367115 [Cucurbitaria berberidis CBS 394.84]